MRLPNVTLVSINCVNPLAGAQAMLYSMRGIEYKESILFTHEDASPVWDGIRVHKIPKLSYSEYNDFVLTLGRRMDCDFILLVQDDGFVVSPELWDPQFLDYDYIGAPWPNEPSWIEQQVLKDEIRAVFPHNRVGNGGFSLRSRKFMNESSRYASCGGVGEDAFLCTLNYSNMIKAGVRFAPLDLAYKFSYENPLLEYGHHWDERIDFNRAEHFGFHGRQFKNSDEIINLKSNGENTPDSVFKY